MKKQKRSYGRCLYLIASQILIGAGNAVFISTDLGASPMNVMSQGLSRTFGMHVGTASNLFQALFFILSLFWDRRYMGASSVFSIFIIGFTIDLTNHFLDPILLPAPFVIRLLSCLIAPVIIGIGLVMLQRSETGMIPNDMIPMLISDHTGKLSFQTIRIIYDVTQLVIGILLGGVFGIGTLIAACLQGPCIQFAQKLIKPPRSSLTSL